jgi:hypothetical protein
MPLSQSESHQNNNSRGDQFPSGKWRGYYSQYRRDHSLWSFDMTFSLPPDTPPYNRYPHIGIIQGSGRDDVGKYDIKNGRFNCMNGRLAFTKKYIKGTGDPNENLGHEVLYQGTVQGHLAAGVRGQWLVATYKYRGEGNFHIWPESHHHSSSSTPSRDVITVDVAYGAASDETSYLLEAASAPVELRNANTMVKRPDDVLYSYVSSTDNECAVCFDSGIDTVLRPCGHIAVCRTCAQKLRVCPICRTGIDSREGYSCP